MTELKRWDVLGGKTAKAQLQGGEETKVKIHLSAVPQALILQTDLFRQTLTPTQSPVEGNGILWRLTCLSLQEWGPESSGRPYTENKQHKKLLETAHPISS